MAATVLFTHTVVPPSQRAVSRITSRHECQQIRERKNVHMSFIGTDMSWKRCTWRGEATSARLTAACFRLSPDVRPHADDACRVGHNVSGWESVP